MTPADRSLPSDPADLTAVDAVFLLRRRELSARELLAACLGRIETRNGCAVGSLPFPAAAPDAVNAWVRVDPEAAYADAARADERLAAGGAPALCGVPIGLKDLYAVAGRRLTASSTLLDVVPEEDCDVWARLASAGMVLIGHTHTHEFAAGCFTDQVGNPLALDRTAGGSSGGSAAALAAGMVPVTTGTDTAGSLRIPSALCGTATIKPTRGLVSIRGIVPLAPTLDNAGPMARTVADCRLLLEAMAGPDPADAPAAFGRLGARPVGGPPTRRVAVSPRLARVTVDPDVTDGLERALAGLAECGIEVVHPDLPSPPEADGSLDVVCAEMLDFHARFAHQRDGYQPATRQLLEYGEAHPLDAVAYFRLQQARLDDTRSWLGWLDAADADLLVEPTVPVVAPLRGAGHQDMTNDADLLALTALWNWTGMPVVSLPAGLGSRSGLPVGVSLVGRPGDDWRLLDLGVALEQALAEG